MRNAPLIVRRKLIRSHGSFQRRAKLPSIPHLNHREQHLRLLPAGIFPDCRSDSNFGTASAACTESSANATRFGSLLNVNCPD